MLRLRHLPHWSGLGVRLKWISWFHSHLQTATSEIPWWINWQWIRRTFWTQQHQQISPKLLKQCALALYIPLHHLFSLSISKHAILAEWKHHSITPIYKSGEKSLVSNYWPIHCLKSSWMSHLWQTKQVHLISWYYIIPVWLPQNHSTTQQLLVFLDNVHHIRNSNDACDVIYIYI